jgi:hypothetical protein
MAARQKFRDKHGGLSGMNKAKLMEVLNKEFNEEVDLTQTTEEMRGLIREHLGEAPAAQAGLSKMKLAELKSLCHAEHIEYRTKVTRGELIKNIKERRNPAAGESRTVKFGKYALLTYEQLRTTDIQYCQWVMKTAEEQEGECSPLLSSLAAWLKRRATEAAAATSIIEFGKYKGQQYRTVAADKPYCQWAVDSVVEQGETVGIGLQRFVGWLRDPKSAQEMASAGAPAAASATVPTRQRRAAAAAAAASESPSTASSTATSSSAATAETTPSAALNSTSSASSSTTPAAEQAKKKKTQDQAPERMEVNKVRSKRAAHNVVVHHLAGSESEVESLYSE